MCRKRASEHLNEKRRDDRSQAEAEAAAGDALLSGLLGNPGFLQFSLETFGSTQRF